MVWSSKSGPNVDLPLWQNRLSRCWGALLSGWSMFHGSKAVQMESVSTMFQCTWLSKSVFMVWSSKTARILTGVHGRTVFQVMKNLMVRTVYVESVGVSWSQSVLFTTALGSESVYSWCDPVKRLEYWLALFIEELFFLVLKNLVVRGGVFSTDGKVLRWIHAAIWATAVGSESVHSWFDPVQMARMLTCLYGKTVFPGVEELVVCGRACSIGRKVSKWSQSVLCTTALGSESVCSLCDPVKRLQCWLAFIEELFFQVLKNLLVRGRVSSTDGKVLRWIHAAILATAVWLRKCVFMVWSSKKWPECWLAFTAKPSFQVLRSLVVSGRACSVGQKVSKWSQSVLCTTALGSESAYSRCDPVKRLEYWLAFIGELIFQVLKNLVERGRVSSTDDKVLR